MFYTLLSYVAVVLASPYFLYRTVRTAGYGHRLCENMGFWPAKELERIRDRRPIWIHAASVGEIVAASPLVKELHRRQPQRAILITTITVTGQGMARRIMPEAAAFLYFPFDWDWLTRKLLRLVDPSAFVVIETELWPMFLQNARKQGVPVLMANGRIGDKSAKRYHYLGSLLQSMMQAVDVFCMQSAADAERIAALGAATERIRVTGNTKYDQTYTQMSLSEQEELRFFYQLGEERPVWVAGSTHPGEEEQLLAVYARLRADFPHIRLIIAPREIRRAEEIVTLAETQGCTAVTRSRLVAGETGAQVTVIDAIGELGRLYSLADVVFVGGSLITRGGHNILEPAAHGKPILTGSHMFNFREIHTMLSRQEACITVADSDELERQLRRILMEPELAEGLSRNARAVVRDNGGASARIVDEVEKLLL